MRSSIQPWLRYVRRVDVVDARPISSGWLKRSNASSNCIWLRLVSMVITSASSAATASMRDEVEVAATHTWVDLGAVRHRAGAQPEGAHRPVQIGLVILLAQGKPSRIAGSSIWMILMPAASRSATSSRMARPICRADCSRLTSSRGRTSRGWSRARSASLHRFVGQTLGELRPSRVMGSAGRCHGVITGGLTQREP